MWWKMHGLDRCLTMTNLKESVLYYLVLLVACHYLLMWLSNTFMIIHKWENQSSWKIQIRTLRKLYLANIVSQTLHIEHLILKLLKGVWKILVINKYYVIVVNSLRLCYIMCTDWTRWTLRKNYGRKYFGLVQLENIYATYNTSNCLICKLWYYFRKSL